MSADEIAVIRTFLHEFEANVALAQLQAAGIQALILSGGQQPGAAPGPGSAFGLAVHRRDAERALELLPPPPSPA